MNAMKIDVDAIRSLAELLEETNLNEIEITQADSSVRVTRNGGQVVQTVSAPVASVAAEPVPAAAPQSVEAAAPAVTDLSKHPGAVTSPMVGTAYLKPDPESDSFVSVGQSVSEGDTLLIVEAMKVMNPIKASKSGTVKQIIVTDAQPVEFGEVLLIIE